MKRIISMDVGSVLSQFYNNLAEDNFVPITMYHSTTYYVKAALEYAEEWSLQESPPRSVRESAKKLSLKEFNEVLYEEGHLPHYEYDIPFWYARKWLLPNRNPNRKGIKLVS